MRRIMWLLSLLGALGGAGWIVLGLTMANGAPQKAAAAGLGCAFAIIPYVLARAYSEMSDHPSQPPAWAVPPRR